MATDANTNYPDNDVARMVNRKEPRRISFMVGFLITLFTAVLVPILADVILTPMITQHSGSQLLSLYAGPMLTTAVVWAVVLSMRVRMSAKRILHDHGIPGVLGLIAAYWYIGDMSGALLPLLSIVAGIAYSRREAIKEWAER